MTVVTSWLAVRPLDTVMVRDGRGFDAGVASVATAATPLPSTLGGAVWAAVGTAGDGVIGSHLVGPVVATAGDGPVFPVPQDVVRDDHGDLWRLTVEECGQDDMHDLAGSLTHLLVGAGAAVGGFFDADALADWLAGDGELVAGEEVEPQWWRTRGERRPWHEEQRVGLALQQEGEFAGTAEPGLLYAMTHLRPADGTHFLVGCVGEQRVTVPAGLEPLVPIGGRGRLAAVTGSPLTSVLPDPPDDFPAGHVAVYLATPALLDDVYWCPPGATLRAVAVSGPQPVATASPRDGLWATRRLSWAVPAGSVFYLDFGADDAARAWAHTHHGGLLPGQQTVRLATSGFGTCLAGRW